MPDSGNFTLLKDKTNSINVWSFLPRETAGFTGAVEPSSYSIIPSLLVTSESKFCPAAFGFEKVAVVFTVGVKVDS